ncbi:hypothetical protein ERO13_A11G061666v2 [Gossypium hirsutum]|uniref:Pentatricopeptide repeat-containing protein At1g20230 n=1 Tax=Gossypium hirsutum TaxID=3635 RepID=A0ABM2Z4A4_GOSHI|nr:pentatricopeptide repeat-containing protein At1g20230-like [Gossypium hirsutum]KAG4173497.1 hypothetical protein ERO13_A11G061666v2 [Gossypium hirsutum]
MPVRPEAGVWGHCLELVEFIQCRTGRNRCQIVTQLDAENPGRYVLLSNIYASLGKRREAYRIRNLMKSRGVKKKVGWTSIEIKGKMYTFVAGDRANPEMDLIYSELGKLMERIRQEGYIPDVSFVLHDVEGETKEMMLYAHSEKLPSFLG